MRHRSRSLARLLTVLILLASWAGTARAQTQGGIDGRVTDPSGSAMSGADVTVTNKATHATRSTKTYNEGLYAFPSLPPGVYELTVAQKGFKTAEFHDVQLQVQQTARLDVG